MSSGFWKRFLPSVEKPKAVESKPAAGPVTQVTKMAEAASQPTTVNVVQPITEEKPMSFISVVEGAEHTFAAWAEKELGKLSSEAPAITKIVDTIVTYVGGASEILAGIEGGAAASAAVKTAVSAVQSGVTALSGLVTDFGATPTVASIATSLATNTSALLSAAKVTNPTSVAAATGIINNLTTLATALTTASSTPATSAA